MSEHLDETARHSGSPWKPRALDGRHLDWRSFGGKAAQLARVVASGGNVPIAFALSVECVRRIHSNKMADALQDSLLAALEEILRSSPSSSAIVRSSHALECDGDTKWSGRFASRSGVADFAGLLRAIAEVGVTDGLFSPSPGAREYEALPVIIQAEIPCDHSALVLFQGPKIRIELFAGGLAEPISGRGIPTVVIGRRPALSEAGPISLWVEADGQKIGPRAIRLAHSLIADLGNTEGTVLFETGHRDGRWYLFQRQSLPVAQGREISPTAAGPAVGRKAAAMLMFKELGLFGKQLSVWPAGEPVKLNLSDWSFPLTIRFAVRETIGLPRHFVTSETELAVALSTRDPSWAVIIHEFIAVTRSFELLIDHDRACVEHVPGLWESEGIAAPDALIIERDGRCRSYRRRDNRLCRGGRTPDGVVQRVPPIGIDIPVRWAERLSGLFPRLRSAFAGQLPVNLHFVEDEVGEWHFLNSRPGYVMPRVTMFDCHEAFRVANLSDLETWDGLTPLILAVTTERGQEYLLDPLAEQLKRTNVPIYAEFGLLSHPAMALRARGVRLLPAYEAADPWDDKWDAMDFRLDQNSDPVVRIALEPPLYVDDLVRIVFDRDQITPGHLLILAEQRIGSFADRPEAIHSALLGVRSLEGAQTIEHGEWLVYERGRASFCTSGFTDSHAHMHMLPRGAFNATVVNELASATGAEILPDLKAAWTQAKDIRSEYLVFGTLGGPGFLCRRGLGKFEKQFVRRFLTERYQ